MLVLCYTSKVMCPGGRGEDGREKARDIGAFIPPQRNRNFESDHSEKNKTYWKHVRGVMRSFFFFSSLFIKINRCGVDWISPEPITHSEPRFSGHLWKGKMKREITGVWEACQGEMPHGQAIRWYFFLPLIFSPSRRNQDLCPLELRIRRSFQINLFCDSNSRKDDFLVPPSMSKRLKTSSFLIGGPRDVSQEKKLFGNLLPPGRSYSPKSTKSQAFFFEIV